MPGAARGDINPATRAPAVDAGESDGASEPPRSPAELLVLWLAHYQRSANTRAAYARELLLFLGWLRAQRVDAFAVRGADVERYLHRLQRAGLAEASRARALAALAAYYHRAVHEQLVERNPCAIVERPQPAAQRQNQARTLSEAQVLTLLGAARAAGRCTSCWPHCSSTTRCASPRPSTPTPPTSASTRACTCWPCAARAKPRRTSACRSTTTPCARSIATCPRALPRSPAATPRPRCWSPPTRGARLTRQAAYGRIARLADAAGVGPLSPHGLRATLITVALRRGIALRDVQDSARHADPRTTRRSDRDSGRLTRHAALRLELG